MLPYPNDWFTKSDSTSATGSRLNLNALAMPRNIAGVPIDPVPEWNNSDGFSAGSEILAVVPGHDEQRRPGEVPASYRHQPRRQRADQPRRRAVRRDHGPQWPAWAEIDHYTTEAGLIPAGTTSADPAGPDDPSRDEPARRAPIRHRAAPPRDEQVAGLAKQSPGFRHTSRTTSTTRAVAIRGVAHMAGVFADLKEAGWNISPTPRICSSRGTSPRRPRRA